MGERMPKLSETSGTAFGSYTRLSGVAKSTLVEVMVMTKVMKAKLSRMMGLDRNVNANRRRPLRSPAFPSAQLTHLKNPSIISSSTGCKLVCLTFLP